MTRLQDYTIYVILKSKLQQSSAFAYHNRVLAFTIAYALYTLYTPLTSYFISPSLPFFNHVTYCPLPPFLFLYELIILHHKKAGMEQNTNPQRSIR